MPIVISADAQAKGEIYAHLFENVAYGIERDVYWSITIPCASIKWSGEEWETALTCEWLQWPIQNWVLLNGANIGLATNPSIVECSFYLTEHIPVAIKDITLTRIDDSTHFVVGISGQMELEGFGELDGISQFTIHSEVVFQGVAVVPDNLFPKPVTEADATNVLSSFINVDNLNAPIWDKFRYLFTPHELLK
ncbi:hypothetical protein [Chitinibacter sp. GC72]|uniref:hypothetical protein n=1 Tax=Chitinibacter sp. GC72 TaxID=1526917 RepID=UPI0012FCAC24|nr:hypothetical protein [Chitinibacter sp. GC72]